MLNHRERRAQAKRNAMIGKCTRHPKARLVVKGTQVICPHCYAERLVEKKSIKFPDTVDTKSVELKEELKTNVKN